MWTRIVGPTYSTESEADTDSIYDEAHPKTIIVIAEDCYF